MRARTWIAAVVFVVGAAPAMADMPPPDGYVEQCTVAKLQTASSECLECRAWVSHRSRCTNFLVPYCYNRLCQSYGASAWTEVFCRTKDANAPVVPSDVLGSLSASSGNEPDAPDGGAVAPSNCAPYYPPTVTGTGTATNTNTTGDGCSISNESSAMRALGTLALVLAGLALMVLRRRKHS
jgi:hypothetical protein